MNTKNVQPGKKFLCPTVLICLVLLMGVACKEAIYAPVEGDTIRLSANPITIKPGETSDITVTGLKANGRPMPDNTVVILMADSGTFQDEKEAKAEALLLIGGMGKITYKADASFTGEAVTITASAGTAAVKPEQLVIGIETKTINAPPVAAFTFSPTNPRAGETVRFNAEASTDPDGEDDIVSYEWDFGGGIQKELTPPERNIVGCTYDVNEEKTFTVTLNVIDKDGAEGIANAEITVRPSPVARFTFSPAEPVVKEYVTFDAGTSEGDIKEYQWNYGDGNLKTTTTQVVMHKYKSIGFFIVTLTVTDVNEHISVFSARLTVKIKN